MKKPSATHSTSYSATVASRGLSRTAGRLIAVLWLLTLVGGASHAQTAADVRQRAIAQWAPPRDIDRSKLARQGFRLLDGRHVTLVTDLPSSSGVDELPQVMDAAVPLLAERFNVSAERMRDWHVLAMLLADREKFEAAGLMPRSNETFPHGLSIGYELWVANQSSDYYRRHLLLHELTHSFMATQLGGCGPGWYMEGMAELMGTHRWHPERKQLELAVMPEDRRQYSMWGRTKLVAEAVEANRLLPVAAVMRIDNTRILEVESYAWVWSLAKLLDTHPRYRDRFRRLQSSTLDPDFDQRFAELMAPDRSNLETEWRLFASRLDYGYDIAREAIDFPADQSGLHHPDTAARTEVAADRGWQSTGLVLKRGERYELTASGRFVVGQEPDGQPWISEPGGITLDYYGGEPLGKLLAVLDSRRPGDPDAPPSSAFLTPTPIGLSGTLEPDATSVLYLRLNDSPASLNNNRGTAQVRVRRLP